MSRYRELSTIPPCEGIIAPPLTAAPLAIALPLTAEPEAMADSEATAEPDALASIAEAVLIPASLATSVEAEPLSVIPS